MDNEADRTLIFTGRIGHADFINGSFQLQDETVNGKPVYLSDHEIPDGYDDASGCKLYLYFHEENDAWVVSHVLNSLDVIAFAPSRITSIWHVATGKGPFVPDPTVKLIAASTGKVLTRLGAWTVEPSGEVALKIEHPPEPGSERPMTIVELLRLAADRFSDQHALASIKPDGTWAFRTYRELFDECVYVARALVKLGLRKHHTVLIYGTNAAEWTITAIGACACARARGVMLSHDNITWTARTLAQALGAEPAQDRLVSYLPLANMAAQMMHVWMPIAAVATVYFGKPDPFEKLDFMSTLRAANPTLFVGIPWVWRRLYEHGNETKRLSAWAARKGMKGSIRLQRGEGVNWKFKYANKNTFSKIKKAIGLDECRLAMCIDSNLSPAMAEYFLAINLPVFESYGCAECAGVHTISIPGQSRPASAGKQLPGTQVRMTHGSHEILMYGRHVMMGYLFDPDATSDAIDERGWLHTGDIGQADRSGFLYVTGRQPDLLLTAGGAYVPPVPIETALKAELRGLVSNAVLVGAKRKSLGVLLTLNTLTDDHYTPTDELAPDAVSVLREMGCTATTASACLNGPHTDRVMQFVHTALENVNAKVVSEDQRVTRFEFLPRGLSQDTRELGPTFKLRRHFIAIRHANVIDRMYEGEELDDYEQQPWYHGPITRADTINLLKRDGGGYDGWFLIRLSTKEKNTFVITLCFKGKLYHNQIKYADGVYSTHKDQGNHQYNTLQELVNHHREGKNGFQTVLTRPCARPTASTSV
ncbi:hypothetical protein PTSG_10811 [Salpingoeca rosetta]|uniref:SH2 domain-containing protein n=1 Tax=Salpingoeca rosetta (strain ATCC 50818 / BSB-021) TaxID=946362 RepID=F2UPZ8_SALR5|nr:uncharacterized protein PTSG_10811 [Salpingoeca rosetta]EGD79828.1 hypothetical protein PTSG_10811 [Salpingoeca rosetta]|eukprot:XP_004988776.1 hypothetical protein PTSG_10811 [Salpingoeca rosetta]